MTENNSDHLINDLARRVEDLHDKLNALQGDVGHALTYLEEGDKILHQAAPLIDLAKAWTSTSSKFKGFLKR